MCLCVCLSVCVYHLSFYSSVRLSVCLSVSIYPSVCLLSVQESDVTYVPCSGLSGENLTQQPHTEELLKWYEGHTLMEEIDRMEPPSRLVDRPFRCSLTDIFKGSVEGFCVRYVVGVVLGVSLSPSTYVNMYVVVIGLCWECL